MFIFILRVLFNFFLRKKPKKMSLTNEKINLRLAEIYRTINKFQELEDAVMYNPLLDNAVKELFLNWYD